MSDESAKNKPSSLKKTVLIGLAVLVGLIIYAYGFQVTKVSLAETRSPRRQTQLQRIIRALAHPDIFEYDQQEFNVSAPVYLPCPEGELNIPEPDTSGPYMTLNPQCAGPKGRIRIEGFNFEPYTKGPINFIPPSGVKLQMGTIETDADGHWEATITLPNRQPVADAQYIRTTTRRKVGAPHFTQTAKDTWDKIIETVFMALLATTLGTMLAIPLSFFAARNLMKEVASPLSSVALSVLAWPVGIGLGAQGARWMAELSKTFSHSTLIALTGALISPLLVWFLFKFALPQTEEEQPATVIRLIRMAALLIAALLSLFTLYLIAHLAGTAGNALADRLGAFGFLGIFVADLGDILNTVILLITAIAVGGLLSNLGSRIGQTITEKSTEMSAKIINIFLAAAAGATLGGLIGAAIKWLYQVNNPAITLWWPLSIGVVAGILIAARAEARTPIPVGMSIYIITRTILNALRSIEPLVMVIVFAVWVGIGPFAGVLALSLHTIASLAKLYSEQVESILPGPIEAIKATGATRLQTIVYAVIPQIVPPYIAFTMYRWDINVRMSTIIGFAGGGGIGFLLQQNINLLNYRAASAQMFAIAIVVASMDYISSKMRERVV